MLPQSVLDAAYKEFYDYRGSGMSIMEINHRSVLFNELIDTAKQNLRDLLAIPDNYTILFLQGGAALQFSAVPMNLMKNRKAGFIITGHWAKRAFDEAKMYGEAVVLASSEDRAFSYIPDVSNLPITEDMDYVHICENNTIYGTRFVEMPDTKGVDLVSDMSSCILSEPIDVSKYALIYAGAQKNIGTAGVTLVIVRNDLVTEGVLPGTPLVMRYKKQADSDSRFNTPPCYPIYICSKMFEWLNESGGLTAAKQRNQEKADMLYDFIDNSKLYHGTVDKKYRSMTNVTFTTGDQDRDMEFVEDSKKYGFVSIKGHRYVGGLRASLYNAMPLGHVKALIEYMTKFEKEHL